MENRFDPTTLNSAVWRHPPPDVSVEDQSFRGERFFAKPFRVTAEEADAVLRFVDAIKPGVYLKCCSCSRFLQTEEIHYTSTGPLIGPMCGRCA